jgi:hypothetical protein
MHMLCPFQSLFGIFIVAAYTPEKIALFDLSTFVLYTVAAASPSDVMSKNAYRPLV